MTYDIAVETLLCRYKEIYKSKGNSPDWATPKTDGSGLVHPSIPFVGKDYFNQPVKILMYASAENLNGYNGYLDDDALAINRHRAHFDYSKENNDSFPNVHIQPINNGALVICAFHILSKLMPVEDCSPAVFLEKISFGNYGKYTIDTKDAGKNYDYADKPEKLCESQKYIKADIEILQPDYIIMVKQMYSGKGKQKAFIDELQCVAKVIPIPQVNAGNINRGKAFGTCEDVDIDSLHPTVKRWFPKCKETSAVRHFLRVFYHLDKVMQQVIEQ